MNLLDLARSALDGAPRDRSPDAPVLPPPPATPAQAAEIRALLGVLSVGWPDDERADALAAALADPANSLACFRALVAERRAREAPQPVADDGLRSCWQCSNFGHGGRCLAAQRGESLGAGIGGSTRYEPALPDRPQRCIAFAPLPADADQRPGRERWPMLLVERGA